MYRHSREDLDSVKSAVSAMMGDEKETDRLDLWIERQYNRVRRAITGEVSPSTLTLILLREIAEVLIIIFPIPPS